MHDGSELDEDRLMVVCISSLLRTAGSWHAKLDFSKRNSLL